MPNVLLHYSKHQRPRTQQLALQHPALSTRAQKATQPITQPQTAPVTSQTQLLARLEATTLTIPVALHVPRRCLANWGRSALFRPACPMHCLCFGFAENLSKLSPILINKLPMKLPLRVDLWNNSLDLSMSR